MDADDRSDLCFKIAQMTLPWHTILRQISEIGLPLFITRAKSTGNFSRIFGIL